MFLQKINRSDERCDEWAHATIHWIDSTRAAGTVPGTLAGWHRGT
jgi:hypothetical protein